MNTPFKKRGNPLTLETETTAATPVVQQKIAKKNDDRVKYTATMEKQLRNRVKIASVTTNHSFSEFIEVAVLEKLEREGL